jgi:hypothetical protein
MAVIKVTICDSLWREYVAVMEKCGWDPQRLVQTAVLDHVQRLADEDLLAATEIAARRSPKLKGKNVEEVIRQYRREKAKKAANGREKKASGGGP